MINVAHQLPEFVRVEYPNFVDFLKAYYDWFENEYSLGNYSDLVDIDTTITDFLKYFRKQVDVFGITDDDTSRFYLRHLKELYVSKGSRVAFDFLFNILFNREATIKIPWDTTLILSNGKWQVDYSIMLDLTAEEAAAIDGKEITIYDSLGNPYQAMVEYINVHPDGNVEVFISKPYELKTAVTVSSGDVDIVDPEVIDRVVSVTVVGGGRGFSVGQVIEVTSTTGTGMIVRVAAVGPNGEVTAVEIVSFGTGYTEAFTYSLTGGESDAELTFYPLIHVLLTENQMYLRAAADGSLILGDYTVVTVDAGDLYHGFATGDPVIYRNGGGANIGGLVDGGTYYVIVIDQYNIKLATTNQNALDGVAIDLTSGATGSDHTLTPLVYAVLSFEMGSIAKYPGRYKDSSSVLGDGCYIEDSDYYQVFSYVTALEEVRDKYETILRTVLHPAGTKHFAEYTVTNTITVGAVDMNLEYSIDVLD